MTNRTKSKTVELMLKSSCLQLRCCRKIDFEIYFSSEALFFLELFLSPIVFNCLFVFHIRFPCSYIVFSFFFVSRNSDYSFPLIGQVTATTAKNLTVLLPQSGTALFRAISLHQPHFYR